MHILMLYPKFPEHTFWNFSRTAQLFLRRRGLLPPLGLLTIASYLPDDFQVRLIDRNVADESEADWEWADVIFVSLMVAQQGDYRACLEKARRHRKPVAVGGPFTHALPEAALADGDWVCFGEAESMMDELIDDLRADRRGKQYQGGNTTDMETVRLPRFDLMPDLNAYCQMAIQYSRGCPFRCEFCDIIEIYGRVPRTKTPQQILAELDALHRRGFRGLVDVVDDNFIGNKKNAKVMLQALAAWNREHGFPFRFYTEASINLADDDELLRRMARANFIHVFIGLETPDPKLLKSTFKVQNIPGDPLAKLRKIREHGMDIAAGFIIGFDDEDRGVFEVQQSFIHASGIGGAMVNLLTAIPHTQLSRRLKQEGRLLEQLSLCGDTTIEGLNFIPRGEMTKREYLERYARLVQAVYAPQAFFERIVPALLGLRSQGPGAIRGRGGLILLLRLIYHLGVKDRGARRYFWKTLFRVLRDNPSALGAWGAACFYFHHLHRHAEYVQRELLRYLSAPAPEDVLDAVVRGADAPRAAGVSANAS